MSRESADVFDSDALAANRAGRIGDTQLPWLRKEKWQSRSWSLMMGIALVVVGIALFLGGSGVLSIAGALALIAGGVLFLARGVLSFSGLMADLRAPHVVSVDGDLVLSKEHLIQPAPHDEFYAMVGGKRIDATEAQYAVAPQSHRVRLYYLPRGNRAINWECLPDLPKSPSMSSDDRHVLRHSLLGRWSDGMETLEFRPDGSLGVTMANGKPLTAKWALDEHGKLTGDLWGNEHVDVQVGAGGLTITRPYGPATYTRAG